ncbi:DUF1554 domain-containing protein [Leptospira selangorensis]|uniref:DUF1554 domain-containing protein n=1 Tax=Leptospira selangorensis TaxID=2484982 RepID=A0A5F2BYE5_9LEPT|nr:DUF1554 domain-containing protein [Leptospira selangorensis]TGM16258.1 DUF1554 domain-containing protein [Leptospira selangorensis]TGM17791.1 DUF1554 domain-containing protein [Leptospira selangorensis]
MNSNPKILFRLIPIVSLFSLFSFCNQANPINLDGSSSAAGVLLNVVLPGIIGAEPIPEGLPQLSSNVMYDAGNTYIDLTFSEQNAVDENFTMQIENYSTVSSPSFVGYNTFTLTANTGTHSVGFALNADDDNCLDRTGDKFSFRITKDSTGATFVYDVTVKDGDYCIFESSSKTLAQLGGLSSMDNHCKSLASGKGLPRDPAHYKAMVGALSVARGDRNPGESLSSTSFFRTNKRYVRKQGNGTWVKVFSIGGTWPPSSDFDNPLIDSGDYWTGMHSGWGRMDNNTCLNGSESWTNSSNSSSGNLGTSSVVTGDAAYRTLDACDSPLTLPFICVYSPD